MNELRAVVLEHIDERTMLCRWPEDDEADYLVRCYPQRGLLTSITRVTHLSD